MGIAWSHALFLDDYQGALRLSPSHVHSSTLIARTLARGLQMSSEQKPHFAGMLAGALEKHFATARQAFAALVFRGGMCGEGGSGGREALPGQRMQCVECGPRPAVLVCDGTALGQRTAKFGLAEEAPPSGGAEQGLQHPQFVLLCKRGPTAGFKKWQDLFLRFARCRSSEDKKTLPALSAAEFTLLAAPVAQLGGTVAAVAAFALGVGCPCPSADLPLAKALAAKSCFESCACGVVGARAILPLLNNLGAGTVPQAALARSAVNHSPLFGGIARRYASGVPPFAAAVFKELATLTRLFIDAVGECGALPARKTVSLEYDWARGHCFSEGLRGRRELPSATPATLARCRALGKGGCTKLLGSDGIFTPGVFLVMCPHAVVYGYSIMRELESPATPFSAFTHRVPDPARFTLVYDNACHALSYGIARMAPFWAQCKCVVDGLHYSGHVCCAKCFDSGMHPPFKRSADINTQACEQCNAFLKKHADSLHQMTSETAMWYIFVLVTLWNLQKQESHA
jgi:hypothetical protein